MNGWTDAPGGVLELRHALEDATITASFFQAGLNPAPDVDAARRLYIRGDITLDDFEDQVAQALGLTGRA